MNDELLDQAIRHYARALPAEMDQAWPLQHARWWNAAHGTPLRRPRHTVRIALGGFVVGVCAALSITSASVSPFAWSHTLASAFSRCGTDFKDGAALSCPLEFFRGAAPATAVTSGTSGGGTTAPPSHPGSNTGGNSGVPAGPRSSSSSAPSSVAGATPWPSASPQATPAPTATPAATPSPVCAAASPTADDLVPNSSFETTLNGWGSWHSTIARVQMCASAPDGSYVEQVTYNPAADTTLCYCFTSAANKVVTNAAATTTYHAVAWVKAAAPSSVGKTYALVIREDASNGSTYVSGAENFVTLSPTFQQISVTYTVKTSGDVLDVYGGLQKGGGSAGAVAGDSFYQDNVELFKN